MESTEIHKILNIRSERHTDELINYLNAKQINFEVGNDVLIPGDIIISNVKLLQFTNIDDIKKVWYLVMENATIIENGSLSRAISGTILTDCLKTEPSIENLEIH